jgi:hypothetical protein
LNQKIDTLERFNGELAEEIKDLQRDCDFLRLERDEFLSRCDELSREKAKIETNNRE